MNLDPEPPNGELQPMIDHLERSVEDFGDTLDGRLNLGYDDDEFDWDA